VSIQLNICIKNSNLTRIQVPILFQLAHQESSRSLLIGPSSSISCRFTRSFLLKCQVLDSQQRWPEPRLEVRLPVRTHDIANRRCWRCTFVVGHLPHVCQEQVLTCLSWSTACRVGCFMLLVSQFDKDMNVLVPNIDQSFTRAAQVMKLYVLLLAILGIINYIQHPLATGVT